MICLSFDRSFGRNFAYRSGCDNGWAEAIIPPYNFHLAAPVSRLKHDELRLDIWTALGKWMNGKPDEEKFEKVTQRQTLQEWG